VNPALEDIIRRDRLVVAASLVAVSLLAWAWVLAGAGMDMTAFEMTRHGRMAMAMTDPPRWTAAYGALMFFMWWIMMVAMMLPSAAPAILLAAALNRRSRASRPPFGPTGAFTAGYLLAWGGFSALAVTAQWWMQQKGLINQLLVGQNRVINGSLLLIAGLWQFSPWKHACLRHCASPAEFLTRYRRAGGGGALTMGLRHGAYCLGCCWFLMGLLFFGGVMNLFWITGLALYVWIEKALPGNRRVARLMGGVLCAWGLWVLFARPPV